MPMYENSVYRSLAAIKMKMKGHGDTVEQIRHPVYSCHCFLNVLSSVLMYTCLNSTRFRRVCFYLD